MSIYGTTLTPGAPAATVPGTAISLDVSSNLIFAGTAQALASFPHTPLEPNEVMIVNSVTVKLFPNGVSVVGTTLTPEAPAITASNTPISLGSTAFIIGTSSAPGYPASTSSP